MLQCEAGYYTASNKRIEIAEHMRYLPMGYFNKNSLGQITSVTTNTMEQMAAVHSIGYTENGCQFIDCKILTQSKIGCLTQRIVRLHF